MNQTVAARAYRAVKISDPAERGTSNRDSVFAPHTGFRLACHSAAPPPIAEYDAWLESIRSDDPRGKLKVTGAKLRRLAIMRRDGRTFKECGSALSMSTVIAMRWINRLPQGLAA
jgi:hypothetical protein